MLPVLFGCRERGAPAPAGGSSLASRMQPGTFEASGYAYPLPYRLFIPEGYDDRRTYPLVLYLHGAGGLGTDGVSHLSEDVAALVSTRLQGIEPTFVLVPQCPPGDEWVNRHDSAPFKNYSQARVPESDASRMTLELLKRISSQYKVDVNRIYVTGPSMGGSGTWDLVTRHPETFAAAVPVTGVNDPSRAPVIARLPVWVFHGTEDGISSVENSREMVASLRKVGSQVRFTELEGVGHDSWTRAYATAEMYGWLLAQRRSSPAPGTR
jgi:predicted peptidase